MSLQNRTPTYQEKTAQLTLSVATVALVPVLVNAKMLIPLNTAAANMPNAYLRAGEISDYAQANVAFAVNDKIYWDNTNSVFTNVAASNTLCGYAIEPSAAQSGAGLIEFNTNAA